jgi:hypothetical protein
MRAVWAVVAAATVTAVMSAGCGESRQSLVAAPSRLAQATASPSRPAPGDPATTRRVCIQTVALVASGTRFFNNEIAALERAAAKGDQAAMVAAAEAINTRFTQMAAALSSAAQKKVSPALQAVLTKGSALLSEIPSPSYAGATADIAKRLSDLAAALVTACSADP